MNMVPVNGQFPMNMPPGMGQPSMNFQPGMGGQPPMNFQPGMGGQPPMNMPPVMGGPPPGMGGPPLGTSNLFQDPIPRQRSDSQTRQQDFFKDHKNDQELKQIEQDRRKEYAMEL